jgi:hypothetical protein
MARIATAPSTRTPTKKGTSLGRRPITSTMNKTAKRRFKKYRGQGR